MVANDDVGSTGIRHFLAGDLEFPRRIYEGQHFSKLPEEEARAVFHGITFEKATHCEERQPGEDQETCRKPYEK
jgi:hypothetical protein